MIVHATYNQTVGYHNTMTQCAFALEQRHDKGYFMFGILIQSEFVPGMLYGWL